MKRWHFLYLPLGLLLSLLMTVPAYAAEVARALAAQSAVRIYVRGREEADAGASLLLGSDQAEQPRAYPLGEDTLPVHTLLLLDNSLSIPKDLRPVALELMHSLINGHIEGELIQVASFDSQLAYLSEYTDDYGALNDIVDNIQFLNQDTYLTDVLYGILDDPAFSTYEGFQRIVLIADGVDNTVNDVHGKTKDDLYQKLQENLFPIHSVGVPNGRNNAELQNMFALSRLTHSQEIQLGGTNPALFAGQINQDHSITVYESPLPDSLKTGGELYAQLKFSDGEKLETRLRLPFPDEEAAGQGDAEGDPAGGAAGDAPGNEEGSNAAEGQDGTGQGNEDASKTGDAGTGTGDADGAADSGAGAENGKVFSGLLRTIQDNSLRFGIAGGILLLLLFLLAFVLFRMRRKKRQIQETARRDMAWPGNTAGNYGSGADQASGGDFPKTTGLYADAAGNAWGQGEEPPTVYAGEEDVPPVAAMEDGREDAWGVPAKYLLRLSDVNDGTKVFQRPLAGELVIGRSAKSCGMILAYDDSIARQQCVIQAQGDRFVIENLAQTNPTKLNGTVLIMPMEIFSGDQIRMGRVTVQAEFLRL